MTLDLLVLSPGRWQGRLIPLSPPIFIIGRDPRCHLRPASTAIDNRHCAIVCREDAACLCDLGSSGGTFVNGRRLHGQVELKNDDHIKVGTIEFTVRIKESEVEDTKGTDPNIILGINDTVLETKVLSTERARSTSGRRRTTSEAAGSLLAQYMKQNP